MPTYAFEALGSVRVQFTPDELNEKSRAAILRPSARQEGIVRYERFMPVGSKRNSRDALAAFARLDTVAAAQIMCEDDAIDDGYHTFVSKLAMYMADNPRIISSALDYLSIAPAIERIGDHARKTGGIVC